MSQLDRPLYTPFDPPLRLRKFTHLSDHRDPAEWNRLILRLGPQFDGSIARTVVAYSIIKCDWPWTRIHVWQWAWIPVVARVKTGFISSGYANTYDEAAALMRNDMDLLRDSLCLPVKM